MISSALEIETLRGSVLPSKSPSRSTADQSIDDDDDISCMSRPYDKYDVEKRIPPSLSSSSRSLHIKDFHIT